MIIKVCGLTEPSDVALAVREGADVVGMIWGVPDSLRSNPAERIGELLLAAKGAVAALLTRSSPFEELARMLELHAFPCVHLCGKEDASYRGKLRRAFPGVAIWQTVGVPVDDLSDLSWLDAVKRAMADTAVDQVVLDSARGGRAGGTGVSFPFSKAASVLKELSGRLVVAGGIGPDNAESAIAALHPRGLDSSSGIELRPGKKDPEKLARLIRIVKNLHSSE